MIDGKSVRQKLIGSDDERAVSPVIGVILMVAITVILAAVIAAFVLDMGQGQSANAQAGIDFSENSSASEVKVTLISDDRTDGGVTVSGPDCGPSNSGEAPITEVGGTVTCSNGDDITVTAEYDGKKTVINTWEA